jgi:ABC-2 type transporter.
MNSAVGRLVQAELKLMMRDPLVLTFVVAFPIVTMLIIGGAFGTQPDQAFDYVNPAHWYVASYLTVVIAAMGLVMLPVHLASYRERGVLRRFAAAGVPALVVPDIPAHRGAGNDYGQLRAAARSRRAGLRHSPDARVVASHGRAGPGLDRLRQPRRGARLGAPIGAIRPGRRPADLLPVVPARRGRAATARDGLGSATSGWAPAADAADQRGARPVARPGTATGSLIGVAVLAVAATAVAARRTAL